MMPEILFNPSPEKLHLADGEVHVFCTSLDQPVERMSALAEALSEDERARARRFHFGKDQNRFVAGRGMLRKILGWLLNAKPADLIFSYGSNGKPQLAGPVKKRCLHFNLAHSDSLVIYAVSRTCEVGIDVEHIRPVGEADEIAVKFFTGHERAQWHSLPNNARMQFFFDCWVRKEALLKMRGEGIGDSLNQSEMSFFSGKQFSIRSLVPAFNYTAAVAAGNRISSMNCWEWKEKTRTNPTTMTSNNEALSGTFCKKSNQVQFLGEHPG